MTIEQSWQLLDWEYVCDQPSDIRALYSEKDSSAEYGVNWFEFIYTTDELYDMASKWWNGLDEKTQKEMLYARLISLRNSVAEIEEVIQCHA